MTPQQYVEDRVQDQINWYDSKSVRSQRIFKRLRLTEIVAAALIPFLSGVAISFPGFQIVSTVIMGVLGITVTIITGILSLGQHQEHWIEYRATSESLKKEKFLFQAKVEPYNGEDAFSRLVQRVETLASKENTNWAQYMMKPQQEKVGGKG